MTVFARSSLALCLCLALAGCQPPGKPARGGVASSSLGGIARPVLAPQTAATVTQPDNPAAITTQTVERQETRQESSPMPTVRVTETPTPAGIVRVTEQFAGPVLTHTVNEKTATTIGPSWQDKAGEIAAKMAGNSGIRAAGVGLLIFALACFHPVVRRVVGGGKTIPALAAVGGLALIFGGTLIIGHEPLAMLITAGALGVAFLVVRLSHKEGAADALAAAPISQPNP